MVQAISHHPLTTEAHVQTQASPCSICGGLRETGTGYSVYSSFCGWNISLFIHFWCNIISAM